MAPRAYHSGDFEEIGWILARLRERSAAPLLAAGVSLGGNALLRWAEEAGDSAARSAAAVAAVCSPVDLAAGGHALAHGFNRQVYTRLFLRTMKPRALAKLAQFPGLFDRQRLLAARDLYEFDNVFTAPLHGFVDTDDYWARASAKPLAAHDPHSGADAQRAQRPLRPCGQPARDSRGRRPRHVVATCAWRSCRLCGRTSRRATC